MYIGLHINYSLILVRDEANSRFSQFREKRLQDAKLSTSLLSTALIRRNSSSLVNRNFNFQSFIIDISHNTFMLAVFFFQFVKLKVIDAV
jgi:hypothetical protein